MKIAVLMSTYNGEKYVAEQIDSILAQKLGDVKLCILIRDDGSSDSTPEILEKYEAEHNNIVFVNKDDRQNLGIRESFLALLKFAYQDDDYDYFSFSDQDDVWLENKLYRGIKSIEKAKPGDKGALYYSNKTFTDEKLNVIREEKIKYYNDIVEVLWTSLAFGCTMVFDSRLAGICLREHPTTTIFHDSWVYHIAKMIGSKVIFDKKSQILYRQHGDNNIGIDGTNLYHDDVLYWIKRAIPVMFKKHSHGKQKYIEEVYNKYKALMPDENKRYAQYMIRYRFNPIAKFRLICNKYMRKRDIKSQVFWCYTIIFNRI